MEDFKTVDSPAIESDMLLRKQKEDVAKMRASLLACEDNPRSTASAMRNITVLRIYHQMNRIIRYTEMMDKLEAVMYDHINGVIDQISYGDSSPANLVMLVELQTKLQDNMIKSHKLLEPYLNMPELYIDDISEVDAVPEIMDKQSRDKLRIAAQQVLASLESEGTVDG